MVLLLTTLLLALKFIVAVTIVSVVLCVILMYTAIFEMIWRNRD